ncbi:MAG TPA: UDP-3-O-(3-hydroxymyristoyl)glucosamine N-acyltransferase [Allocoleopsis sp.]
MTIHPTVIIDPTAIIGENVDFSPRVVIHSGVIIGNDVKIGANVVIYPDVKIGDRTIISANSTIQERTIIGADCIIQNGAVIGSEGFGFVPTKTGWYKMQQSGYVILEDGVKIGCNVTIDRPAVGITKIGKNTILDNMVHIGHNSSLGENCQFDPQVGLAGGTKVGNNVKLGLQTGIANQALIKDGANSNIGTGIASKVSAGKTISGNPYLEHQEWVKSTETFIAMPAFYTKLQQILKQGNQDEN